MFTEKEVKDIIESNFDKWAWESDWGHLAWNHINLSKDELEERIFEEDLNAASTFIGDEDEICDMVKSRLLEKAKIITCWLNSSESTPLRLVGEITNNNILALCCSKRDGAYYSDSYFIFLYKVNQTFRMETAFPK